MCRVSPTARNEKYFAPGEGHAYVHSFILIRFSAFTATRDVFLGRHCEAKRKDERKG